ncbi:MAG: malonate transporter subunit MadM [Saprospiraceae bacterium]
MEMILKFLDKNGLIFAFLVVGIIIFLSTILSKKFTNNKIPYPAIAIIIGLIIAYIGGFYSNGEKGIADISLFSGMGTLGGSMFRDFAIVATSIGASIIVIKRTGWLGVISLLVGITLSFVFGVLIGIVFGYKDAISLTTIGAGACTYIVGPVTGSAIGASSDLIALSIATGVFKAILVAVGTPFAAKSIGLNNPQTAMVYGGMIGTNAGVMAGLAATDPKLVPYGAITATFYTGMGCLLCPSIFFLIMKILFP